MSEERGTTPGTVDKNTWRKKAMAFVTRSHRHLWGKNNEDPLVFLYHQGLSHEFIQKQHLGWNKFGQERPMENWGFEPEQAKGKKLFLPPGIVVPYIVEKKLRSVFIHPFEKNKETIILPGSFSPTLILGERRGRIAVVHHMMDGLFLFQQGNGSYSVAIHPDTDRELDH